MNKRQKEILQSQLDNEKAVLKELEKNYQDALLEINGKIELLMARQDADMQHVIYQVEYQQALKTQVQAILENLQTNEFETLSDYLTKSYEEGFMGTMYNLHGQGIPLIFPMDQAQIVDAIQHETNLSSNLYTEMGKDIKRLQKQIAGEISRGISSGMMYAEIARNVANYSRIPMNRAMTIARTESHRISTKAAMDACEKAKSKGADIVKVWDASLDKRTRDSHAHVDGEIRELDEKFSNGLMYPGDPNGRPEEVINCRCALLQRARWAVGNDFTKAVKGDDGDELAIIEADKYDDFKEAYQRNIGKRAHGLGASDKKYWSIPPHKKPDVMGNVGFNDKKAVADILERFEKEALNETIETACVIAKDGTIYKCYGVEDGVFPDEDLGDKLIGAIVSHNHPITTTEFSFSSTDFQLFQEYHLEILRGSDVKYKYELNRSSNEVDEHISVFDYHEREDATHSENIIRANVFGVGYRRWKNE